MGSTTSKTTQTISGDGVVLKKQRAVPMLMSSVYHDIVLKKESNSNSTLIVYQGKEYKQIYSECYCHVTSVVGNVVTFSDHTQSDTSNDIFKIRYHRRPRLEPGQFGSLKFTLKTAEQLLLLDHKFKSWVPKSSPLVAYQQKIYKNYTTISKNAKSERSAIFSDCVPFTFHVATGLLRRYGPHYFLGNLQLDNKIARNSCTITKISDLSIRHKEKPGFYEGTITFQDCTCSWTLPFVVPASVFLKSHVEVKDVEKKDKKDKKDKKNKKADEEEEDEDEDEDEDEHSSHTIVTKASDYLSADEIKSMTAELVNKRVNLLFHFANEFYTFEILTSSKPSHCVHHDKECGSHIKKCLEHYDKNCKFDWDSSNPYVAEIIDALRNKSSSTSSTQQSESDRFRALCASSYQDGSTAFMDHLKSLKKLQGYHLKYLRCFGLFKQLFESLERIDPELKESPEYFKALLHEKEDSRRKGSLLQESFGTIDLSYLNDKCLYKSTFFKPNDAKLEAFKRPKQSGGSQINDLEASHIFSFELCRQLYHHYYNSSRSKIPVQDFLSPIIPFMNSTQNLISKPGFENKTFDCKLDQELRQIVSLLSKDEQARFSLSYMAWVRVSRIIHVLQQHINSEFRAHRCINDVFGDCQNKECSLSHDKSIEPLNFLSVTLFTLQHISKYAIINHDPQFHKKPKPEKSFYAAVFDHSDKLQDYYLKKSEALEEAIQKAESKRNSLQQDLNDRKFSMVKESLEINPDK